ncbi:hypothetical protein K3495_g8861 [Podosphaera aphanis]|nr:hypothetical protein K3495_g8861 [Podosphaera aphanis]
MVVALSINYDAFRNLSRPDELTLDVLDEEGTTGSDPCEVSELARITNQDFNNSRRRYLKIFLGLTQAILKAEGDYTHRKAYLYTIFVKHDVAGKGVPVAFMITSSEAQGPLASKKSCQAETIFFAENTLGIEISQPQVSKRSSDWFDHLDAPQDKSFPSCILTPNRDRERNLHNLELALYTWMKQYETRVAITGDALRVKASKLFHMMPMSTITSIFSIDEG